MNWSSTDELWLATLWENGQSLRAISRAMEGKYSPSAISGKSWRMGLAKRGSPVAERKTPRIIPCAVCGAMFDRRDKAGVRHCEAHRVKPLPRDRIVVLRKWGLSVRAIAKEIGRHPAGVYGVLVSVGMNGRVPKRIPERSAA
jgi:hypothetical protein